MKELIIPRRITTSFIRANPDYIFVYGLDVQMKGGMGQSIVAFGEPNCYPIFTCWKNCKNGRYFQDNQFEEIVGHINRAVNDIVKATQQVSGDSEPRLVIPFPKIVEGGSRMREFAPRTWNYLQRQLRSIEYPNIVWDYNHTFAT